ncbi:MAG: SGNH/GDSL hydrolase family protein [Fulvivirga sp.]|uniref:SGNH/GDSL hydrolase family protein n=1 Tax=Fulvivirga sp. TaxID=1931237 RepID=UPI0032EB06F7
MKNIKYIFYTLLSASVLITSCDSEDDLIDERLAENPIVDPNYNPGSLDISNYVAVGNSLSAGFADAALFPQGQMFSFPNIIGEQLQKSGGNAFVYPDITSGNGFGGLDDDGMPEGRSFISLEIALAALAGDPDAELGDAIQNSSGTALNTSSTTGSSLNNFGVPGARVIDLGVNGYGAANPFYGAFQSSASASILEDAVSANGTLFSLWIGSNDVLGYATSGGVKGEAFNPTDPQTITDAATFQAAYSAALDALTANGAEGVVLNVPPVTIIPFFQIVTQLGGGINLIPLTEQAQVDALNGAYAAYNGALDAAAAGAFGPNFTITAQEAAFRKITWQLGANPPVLMDESLTDLSLVDPALVNMRQAQVDPTTGATDLFPLTALAVIGTEAVPGVVESTIGTGVPIEDQYTLTLDEQVNVITAYATFNGIIAAEVAARPNVHMVDVGPLFADIFGLSPAQAAGLALSTDAQAAADGSLGIDINGFNMVPLSLSQEELFNSIWSTDGVHPNARGAAIVANEIIKKLNSTFNANIPTVNPLDYPGINAL